MAPNLKNRREEALRYHSEGRPGKIEVIPTKPYSTQYDLALAYSPGVAEPCLEIEHNPDDAYRYTAKGNLVAVISNGTAVLGLGNIGPLAGKPVMEGKGLLFKTFADIDVFDIEVATEDVETFIRTVKNISPTFGGINLEDIKAPECFEIEEKLKNELNIPVMHDDQHGTAIISGAALINALELVGKKIDRVLVVVNGAGAAAVSCAKLYKVLGVRAENIIMCDSKGPITTSRANLNAAKKEFVTDRKVTSLEEAMVGADVFLGLSVADTLTRDMIRTMADDPIVMALANPNPEISYEDAMESRPDIIFATGRSDYPNQVNNVLGFPYIFRGALDVRATTINEQMKIAASYAIAALAKQPVPEVVTAAYGSSRISFGRDYLIPKPLDPRLLTHISAAVAKAAIESGVARHVITDWDEYIAGLEGRMGRDNKILRRVRTMVASAPGKRVVFSEGELPGTIKSAAALAGEKLMYPILIGDRAAIEKTADSLGIDTGMFEIVDFRSDAETPRRELFARLLSERMSRKGMCHLEAMKNMKRREWFTMMMVASGEADTSIIGYSRRYTRMLPHVRDLFAAPHQTLATMHIVSTVRGPMFFTDTAINTNPTAGELADIAVMAAASVRRLGIEPVIAMVSHSNFGSDTGADAAKVADAVKIVNRREPELMIDGEMKPCVALNVKTRKELYPFCTLEDKDVNTLIFPNLSAANISYQLLELLGRSEVTGPIMLGLKSKVYPLSDSSPERTIRNIALIAAANAGLEE